MVTMKTRTAGWMGLLWLFVALAGSAAADFRVSGNSFLLDGKRLQIRSGEIHYARVPREEWGHRIEMAKAMGLNTISTYVFWNYHETRRGEFDFTGEKDVAEFIGLCGRMGMHVIARPGPYVCAEWELGGLPAWLLAARDIRLRSTDPRYLEPAKAWMHRMGTLLQPLAVSAGGPVLLVQLENEFGMHGRDEAYLKELETALRGGGYAGLVFTDDGAFDSALRNGGREGLLKAVNFGDGAPSAFDTLARAAPGQPPFSAEFWVGWFDGWGRAHKQVATRRKAEDLKWMMRQGASFNLYMFHGGTTRGLWTGANWANGYDPTCDNYDYDAPLDESGRPTAKYTEFREIIGRFAKDETLPPVPVREAPVSLGTIRLDEQAALAEALPEGEPATVPRMMEDGGQITGCLIYRCRVDGPLQGALKLAEVKDRVYVLCDGKLAGIGGRSSGQPTVAMDVGVGSHRLDLIVENMGRINYGLAMGDERRGLAREPEVGGHKLGPFRQVSLPLQVPPEAVYRPSGTVGKAEGVILLRGRFKAGKPGDTWLDMSDFGRGVVWLNGRNLGRYWRVGPSQTLFVPGCWLKTDGENELVVMELENPQCPRDIPTLPKPIWSVPGK